MIERIETALVLHSHDGHLKDELIVQVADNVLHRLYKTRQNYGVVKDSDLLGQSLNIGKGVARSLFGQEIEERFFAQKIGRTKLMTYMASDLLSWNEGDIVLLFLYKRSDGEFFQEVDCGMESRLDPAEFRRLVGLPSRYPVSGEYPLKHSWQIAEVSNLGCPINTREYEVFIGVNRH